MLALVLVTGAVQAADVSQFRVLKGQYFVQTSMGAATAESVTNFVFQCVAEAQMSGVLTNLTFTTPSSQLVTAFPTGDSKFGFEQGFSSLSALNTAFPDGNYVLTFKTVNDGTKVATLPLSGGPTDPYPATPHLSNFTAAQAVDPASDFTLTWDPLGGTVNDFVFVTLRDSGTNEVFSTPSPGTPGSLDGTSTSLLIPARRLRPGQVYQVELFIARAYQPPNTTDYPGASGVAGYFKQLHVNLVTTGTQTGPAVGQFNLVFNFYGGTFNDTNSGASFPQPLGYYFALYNVQNDVNYPASVTFTGPGGSGLTNITSQVNGSSFGTSAFYSSPQVNFSPNNLPPGAVYSPTQPPGGVYSVNYKGTNQQFNLLDPLSASQQVLVVPSVVLTSSNTIQEIRWTYKNSSGMTVAPQPYMANIQLRVDGISGGRLYDAGNDYNNTILPATTNHTPTASVVWTNVSSIQALFVDTVGNQYVSFWTRVPQPLQITTANLPNATQGASYSFLLSSQGGTQPVTEWSIESGFLPSGLDLNLATGEIIGTPGESGIFPVSFRAKDTANSVTNRALTLTVTANSFPAPGFTNYSVIGTAFKQIGVNLIGVSNQTYTLESSTNLINWVPRHTFTAVTNLTSLIDPEALARFPRLFYRMRIGRTFGTTFSFHFYTVGGGFGGAFTPTPGFPMTVNSYAAVLETMNSQTNPLPASVFFTGPNGSGINNSPGDSSRFDAGMGYAQYQTVFRSNPNIPPGGTWTMNFMGSNIVFSVPDPQAASRLVIPVPTVTVSGGNVTGVSWVYKDATTGVTLAGPPAYMTGVKVEIDDQTLGRVYDPDEFTPTTTSVSGLTGIVWNNVVRLYMVYNDTLGNHYIVGYTKP